MSQTFLAKDRFCNLKNVAYMDTQITHYPFVRKRHW